MARYKLLFLGCFQLCVDGNAVDTFESNKCRALLAYLAVEHERPHTREALSELLWPEYSQEAAFGNLRTTLSSLRESADDRSANPPFLLINRSTVQINRAAVAQADIWDFQDGGPVALYRGPFLHGFSLPDSAPYEEWLQRTRTRFSEQAQMRLAFLLDEAEACGDYTTALAWARRRLELEPWREEAHRQAMRALALLGQRAGALVQYEICVRALAEELAVEPEEETRRLRDLIAAGRLEEIHTGDPLPAPGQAPFKGLYFFDEQDTELFFGREHLAARLARRVREMEHQDDPRLLAVVGASGSGKSSLVRAGLVPQLKAEQRRVAVCTPGSRPLQILDALPPDPLWIIDQFEEVFTLCRQEEERAAFIARLLEKAGSPCGVVLVLRADFYANCAYYPLLREALGARQEYIGPMSAPELRRAVEAPAARGGWTYEAGLVDLILRDIGSEPGALPLLQHALLETWKRRRGRQMTLTGYAEAGGVHGAIAKTAERVYGEFGQDEQALARRIFLRLTELGEGAQDTRRRVGIAELAGEQVEQVEVEALLGRLAAARLVTLSEGTAEVAHEALIREWPALREWLSEDREGLRLQRHIADSAEAWERLGRDEGELYRGARLVQALEWATRRENAGTLNRLEREFLAASQERADREDREAEEARRRELENAQMLTESAQKLAQSESRAARRLRLRARLLAGAFVLALVFVGLALWQTSVAQRNAAQAQLARLKADENASLAFARELAAQSSARLESEPDLSTLLALEAVHTLQEKELAVPYDVQQAVHDVAILSRLIWSVPTSNVPYFISFFPDGSKITFNDMAAHVLDANTGATLPFLEEEYPKGVGRSTVSSNGLYLVTGHEEGQVVVWSIANGARLVTIPVPPGYPGGEFSPDGRFIVTSSDDWTAHVWDMRPWLAAGSPAGTMLTEPLHTLGCSWVVALGIAFSPDSRLVTATCMGDSTTRIWELESGKLVREIVNEGFQPYEAAFSPDGARLAVSTLNNIAFVWDVATGKEITRFSNLGSGGIEFSPDGTQLAITGTRTLVFNSNDGQKLFELPGRGGNNFLAYSPDGRRLAVTNNGGAVQMWDTTTGGRGELGSVPASHNVIFNHGSPDGKWLYETMRDGSLILRSGENLQVTATHVLHPGKAFAGFFSRDGSRFLSCENLPMDGIEAASAQVEAVVWDTANWQKLVIIPVEIGNHNAFRIEANGRLAAFGLADNTVMVYDLTSGKELARLPVEFDHFNGIEFSPDGTYLAASGAVIEGGDGGGRVAVWNIAQGFANIAPPKILNADFRDARHMDFSPDGTRLAVSGQDQHGEVWDPATGEQLLLLQGHTADVLEIHYSHDGRYLVTASNDNTVRAWDAASGVQIVAYTQPVPGGMGMAHFSADDQSVIAWGWKEIFYRFIFQDFEQLLEIVRSRVVRGWQPEECRLYLHSETCPELP